MERMILIKGMVCDRCVRVLTDSFSREGLRVKEMYLGKAVLEADTEEGLHRAESILHAHGFEVLKDRKDSLLQLIHEKIKEALLSETETGEHVKIKTFLSKQINKDYNLISSTFSAFENITIEQFIIRERINKAKELIVYSDKTLTDIAYELGYKNISHLTKQFTALTGLTPSHYRAVQSQKAAVATHS